MADGKVSSLYNEVIDQLEGLVKDDRHPNWWNEVAAIEILHTNRRWLFKEMRNHMNTEAIEKELRACHPELNTIHHVKTVWPHFDEVMRGRKTAEIRHNDRLYTVGDVLVQYSVAQHMHWTGRCVAHRIGHVLHHSNHKGIAPEHAMLSLEQPPLLKIDFVVGGGK